MKREGQKQLGSSSSRLTGTLSICLFICLLVYLFIYIFTSIQLVLVVTSSEKHYVITWITRVATIKRQTRAGHGC